MIDLRRRRSSVRLILAQSLMVVALGCGLAGETEDAADAAGAGGSSFSAADAEALIAAQFPEAVLEVSDTRVDDQGRNVALANLDGQEVSFYFTPADAGWALDAVDFDGSFYYIKDLEHISATMLLMGEAAAALENYKAANEAYPAGDSPAVLLVLIPDYLAEETDRHDAWEQDFDYESDGDDYTLISGGADQTLGTDDDIVLHSGEFVGASSREGQGQ